MRRGPRAAVLSVAFVSVVLVGALAAERHADLDYHALQGSGLLTPGKTFSRAATDRPCPGLPPNVEQPRVEASTLHLVRVAKVQEPTSVALRPDRPTDGFLAERRGRVRRITDGKVKDIVLDVVDETLHQGDGGLLALVVDPSGDWLYVERTEPDDDDVITAYPITADGGLEADEGREIIRSGHPSSIQHHGGSLAFDDDGRLYFGFGDGGGLGDPHENGQRLSTLLGKVNRIIPTPDGDDPYEIPDDNPFLGRDDVRPEIWVYGVRNPFRLSYDPVADTVWLGDVGQSCWEEIDQLPVASAGGSNLGWDVLEATHDFEDGPLPPPVVAPVFEINHRRGWCAIVAGPVQRGGALPALDGRLLVSDYCHGTVWSIDPNDPTKVLDTGLEAKTTIAVVRGPAGLPWVLTLDGEVLEVRDH